MKAPLQCSLLLLLCCLAACDNYQSLNKLVNGVEGETTSTMTTATPLVTRSCDGANLNPARSYPARDCVDVANSGESRSGVYRVWPQGVSAQGIRVYCDLEKDGGGWTVIQRRGQFGNPEDFFYRRWRNYKFGFGDLSREFWLGNENLHYLSNQDNYVLRINLKDHLNETRYAQYDEFYIEDESNKFRLWVDEYKGDAGDALKQHDGMFFSTFERDNDLETGNCAMGYQGAWWFNACHNTDLNGLNLNGAHDVNGRGIMWLLWKGNMYSLPEAEMKIRPKSYP